MPTGKWVFKTGTVKDKRTGQVYKYDGVSYASNQIFMYRTILENGKRGMLAASNTE